MIYHIYGRDITASVLPIDAGNELFQVKGFIGKPLISRGNRNYENYFINGRYIKSALLSKAIEEAYKGFMMQHQYPFCVLYFTIDSELLDVNVHPTKMELRFSNNEEIYRKLYQIIRDALTHKELIPAVPVEEKKEEKKPLLSPKIPEPFEKKRIQDIRSSIAKDSPYEMQYPQRDRLKTKILKDSESSYITQDSGRSKTSEKSESALVFESLLKKKQPERTAEEISYTATPVTRENLKEEIRKTDTTERYEQQSLLIAENENGFLTKDAAKKHKIIGQLFDTYWLVEYEEHLFIIDQHAAHEKVLYERTMKRIKNQQFASQTISPPMILTLDLEETAMLEQYRDQLESFGYAVEPFGGKEYAINAIPADFEGIDMKSMFIDMLDDFSNLSGRDAPELILEKVASMSCKAAVKGNQHLSRQEMEALIEELLTLENPYHCPHGRPTIISMSKYEIEKKFKRIM